MFLEENQEVSIKKNKTREGREIKRYVPKHNVRKEKKRTITLFNKLNELFLVTH